MFIDGILESTDYTDDYFDYEINEEVEDLVDNIEIVDFSESTLSPFDLISKSLYEFNVEMVSTTNTITEAETRYIRENGVEPIWESEDHQSIITRFINWVKNLIGKLAGVMKDLQEKIDKKIDEKYKALSARLGTALGKIHLDDEMKKKISKPIKKFNCEIGMELLAKNPKSVITSCAPGKALWNYVLVPGPKKEDALKSTNFSNGKKGAINAMNVQYFINVKEVKDYTSKEEIKKALTKAMIIEPGNEKANYNDILNEIRWWTEDQHGMKLKSTVKGLFNDVKKDLSDVIKTAKVYEKAAKRNDNKVDSAAAGMFISMLTEYVNCSTIVYNVTNQAITQRWFQGINLYSYVTSAVKGQVRKDNKQAK